MTGRHEGPGSDPRDPRDPHDVGGEAAGPGRPGGSARDREHEDFEQLAAGYALSALEPEDEVRFLAHLPACAACERDLLTHLETAAALAAEAPDVEVPDGLVLELRRAVEAESPDAFAAPPAPRSADAGPASQRPADVLPLRRPSPRSRALLAAAAAVVLLVVGLSGTTLVLSQEARTQLARGERLQEAVSVLAQQGGRSVPLHDDQEQVAAVALLHDDAVSLVVDGLAPTAEGTSYVLWALSPYGGKHPVGVFHVRGEGVEVLRDLPLRDGTGDVAGLAVTLEQGDTAPAAPRGVPLAVGTVEA